MGLYRAVILVATALVFVVKNAQAGVCNGRSTVGQIKIPNRTNVTIQYPNQNNPVEFVPYPYQQQGSAPECYTCRGSKCQRCNRVEKNARYSRPASYTKTNIIIDLTKDDSKKSNGKDSNTKNGTVIILQDDNTAYSASGSSAKGGKGVSVSSSASTSISSTDIVASLNEKANASASKAGNTEDIYVLDASKSVSASVSKATTDEKPKKEQSHPAKDSSTSDQPKHPSAEQPAQSQHPSVANTGSQTPQHPVSTVPDQGSTSDHKPALPAKDQPATADQVSTASQHPSADDKNLQPSQPDQPKADDPTPSNVHEKKTEAEAESKAKVTSTTTDS